MDDSTWRQLIEATPRDQHELPPLRLKCQNKTLVLLDVRRLQTRRLRRKPKNADIENNFAPHRARIAATHQDSQSPQESGQDVCAHTDRLESCVDENQVRCLLIASLG